MYINNQGITDICVKRPNITASIPAKDNKVYKTQKKAMK